MNIKYFLNTKRIKHIPEQNNEQSSFHHKNQNYHLSYSLMTLSKLLILAVSSLHVTYEHNFGLACFTARRKGQFFPNENKEPLDHV